MTAGGKVRELTSGDGVAQRYNFTCDGRDEQSKLVPIRPTLCGLQLKAIRKANGPPRVAGGVLIQLRVNVRS